MVFLREILKVSLHQKFQHNPIIDQIEKQMTSKVVRSINFICPRIYIFFLQIIFYIWKMTFVYIWKVERNRYFSEQRKVNDGKFNDKTLFNLFNDLKKKYMEKCMCFQIHVKPFKL